MAAETSGSVRGHAGREQSRDVAPRSVNDWLEHLASDHQAMNQQEWRPCSPLGKMEEIHETKRSACGFLLSNPGAACLVEAVGDIGLEDARSAPLPFLEWREQVPEATVDVVNRS